VQDRRQFNLARGLPDLISVASNAKVNDLKFAGGKERNAISQRSAKSKSVSIEMLSLSGVSGTWKEHLNTRRIAKALILSTAQQCIEKLAIQGYVRHLVGTTESKLQTPGRPWGAVVVALPKPTPEEIFCDVEEVLPPIPVVTSVDAKSPHEAAGSVQILTPVSFTASNVNESESKPSPTQKRWGKIIPTLKNLADVPETSHRSIQEPEPEFSPRKIEFSPRKAGTTILNKILETFHKKVGRDEDVSQCSTSPSSFCSFSSSGSSPSSFCSLASSTSPQPRIQRRRWNKAPIV